MAVHWYRVSHLPERRRDPSSTLHELILREVSDAVIAIDKHGRITYLNPSAEYQYGTTAEEAVGQPTHLLYRDEWLAREDEAGAAAALANEGFWRGEHLHLLRDGRVLRVESSMRVIGDMAAHHAGLLTVVRDVTAARQAQDEIRKREERFHRALSIDTVGVLFFTLGGCITDANAAFERMVGYSVEELRALTHWERLTAPEFLKLTARKARSLLVTGETPPYEKQLIRKDGSVWWGLVSPRRIGAPGPEAECVEFVIDITQSKHAEEALRDADRRKDEFLAILAHELRNPLAPIRTAVGILRVPGVPEPVRDRSREIIERQVAHMARLVDDLLDVSRLSRGKVLLQSAPVSLDEVLDAAIETARPMIEEQKHRLEQRRLAAPVHLNGDLARLSQVFANLLNNAAKYTPAGGTITIDVEDRGAAIAVSVSDTGQGIRSDRLESIFTLFAQGSGAASPTVGGLGIGLALARALVELHGGTLAAFSPGLDRGASFTVTLPAMPRNTVVEPVRSSEEAPRHLGRRVLVVDDSVDAADTTATLLAAAGCVALAAYGGEQALREVARFRPEIVLLDIGMPGLNGLEACHRMRALPGGDAMFIVAVTGWGQEDDRRRTHEAGFNAHLVKPVSPESLLSVVERAPNLGGSTLR